MQYFEQLGLSREPFSNSPDPDFLYYSSQHIACLQELEIAVRLKRGLNVVIGDIGTGKTTLIRRFIKNLGSDKSMRLHLLLDPHFKSPHAFLRMLCSQVLDVMPDRRLNTYALKEMLKKELFERGVENDISSVLIVDEGQKMTPECLEVLRELLNYETNNKKLLQILLFGQRELEPLLASMANLHDRINSYMVLRPLTGSETRAMIEYRLALSTPPGKDTPKLFTRASCLAIHRATGGYPRKTVRLCHKVILNLLIRRKKNAGLGMVRSVIQEELRRGYRPRPLALAAACAAAVVVGGLLSVRYVPQVRTMVHGIESAVATTFEFGKQEPSPFAPPVAAVPDDAAVDAAAADVTGPGMGVPGAEAAAAVTSDAAEFADDSRTLEEYFSQDAAKASEKAYEPIAAHADTAAKALGVVQEQPGARLVPGVVEPAAVSPTAPEPESGAFATPATPAVILEREADEPAADGRYYELPKVLGHLPVMPRENLSVIVRKVYGAYSRANLARVLEANPGLRNANDIEIGQPLVFPVIKPGSKVVAAGLYWLRLAVERDLGEAYGRLRSASLFGFDSRLLPYVASDGALAFAVVLERPFESMEEAGVELGCLPLALQKNAAVIATPERDVSLGQMNELALGVLQAGLSR